MLRFDLSEIVRTPGMRQVYEVCEAPRVDDDIEYASEILARITVTNTGCMLLIRGPLTTAIVQECSRCLEPVRLPISVNIEEDFDLKVAVDSFHHDQVVEVVEDDYGRVFDGKVLCLDVLIRQSVLLDAPLQPLCKENCPGIPVVATDDGPVCESPFKDLSTFFEES